MTACTGANVACVRVLLAFAGRVDSNGATALHYAAQRNFAAVIDLLTKEHKK